jgi:hypothetical protein
VYVIPVSLQLRGVHLHCHLCGEVTHLALPPGVDDLERFVTEPATRWIRSHRGPHLFAVNLLVNGREVTRRLAG